jgi:hypothetical protein
VDRTFFMYGDKGPANKLGEAQSEWRMNYVSPPTQTQAASTGAKSPT